MVAKFNDKTVPRQYEDALNSKVILLKDLAHDIWGISGEFAGERDNFTVYVGDLQIQIRRNPCLEDKNR